MLLRYSCLKFQKDIQTFINITFSQDYLWYFILPLYSSITTKKKECSFSESGRGLHRRDEIHSTGLKVCSVKPF